MTPPSAAGNLVRQAAQVLESGPVHTLDLARAVLGLSGHPGAASAAVFTLLGADPRFQVSGEGIWSLEAGIPRVGAPLVQLDYAVVDVETTGGGFSRGHGMTEVAVIHVSGGVITDEYQTLINPGRSIPPRIRRLTGITNEMVAGAPYFDQIALEVSERLTGRVFVAHNAGFDWRWVSSLIANAVGLVPNVPRLCTLALARRLVPRLRRRSLDSLTDHFRIPIHQRHRAYGDALATARVFLRLLDLADCAGIADLEALRRYRVPVRKTRKIS